MSAYCTIQDIKDDWKSLVIDAAGSAITTAILNAWIAQESAFMDSKIGLRYVINPPIDLITNTQAALVLKRIAIFRVSERVKNKIEVKANATQAQDSDEKYSKNRVRTINDDLDAIAKGLLLLPGVPPLSAGSGVSSFNTDVGYEHKFDVAKQQW